MGTGSRPNRSEVVIHRNGTEVDDEMELEDQENENENPNDVTQNLIELKKVAPKKVPLNLINAPESRKKLALQRINKSIGRTTTAQVMHTMNQYNTNDFFHEESHF